ncbi:MAG TPA: Gfo/Idh/MocA family oxidoreductase [Planctomycetota bacterium]|nr:Gfo/Idh/MocA family oxidoreductase [Planctomycetota bacterium]
MNEESKPTRRTFLSTAGILAAAAATAPAQEARKVIRVGVISAAIEGKPQKTNGHTWHFAQYFHPQVKMEVIRKILDPGSARMFEKYLRNPDYSFDQLPFPDTRISHVYARPAEGLDSFAAAFPGVAIAESPEALADSVDAVWLGDASGKGEDHFDLIAPALKKGLPTFCDKPIGKTVGGTRKILEFAREHGAPLMSSSLFRHEFGMEQALRMRDSGEFGPMEFVLASMAGGYSAENWFVYGQHPVWSVVTLRGAGALAVSMVAREATAHAMITYPDRMPAEVWYGRPDLVGQYCQTSVHFEKKRFEFTPAIEGDFWHGHHYEMFRMAHTFREMVRTRKEPVPHREILEVTAILYAGAKSLSERGRPVDLAEVL